MTEVAPSPFPLLFPFPSSGQVEMADCLTHSNGKPRILSVILIPASIFMVNPHFLSLYLSSSCVTGRSFPILASRGETEAIPTTGKSFHPPSPSQPEAQFIVPDWVGSGGGYC
jgi:hypothetical protein